MPKRASSLRRRRRARRAVGARRKGQAAVEGRLGDALGRARRRLRDGGKDLIDSVVQSARSRASSAAAARGLQLRDVPRREGREDLQVQGQRPDDRGMAAYGSEESLAFYIYREPKKAKSLHIGVIPRAVDEYWQFRGNYPDQPLEQKLGNPVHHIHGGKVPEQRLPVTYGLLAQPRQPAGVHDEETAWKFVQRYAPGTSPETDPELDQLIGWRSITPAISSFPTSSGARRRIESAALRDLIPSLRSLGPTPTRKRSSISCSRSASALSARRACARRSTKPSSARARARWFQALYETLLGSSARDRAWAASSRSTDREHQMPSCASSFRAVSRNFLRSFRRVREPAFLSLNQELRFSISASVRFAYLSISKPSNAPLSS
jgi:hypothetical protein